MKVFKRSCGPRLAALALLGVASLHAAAAEFPTRPVRFVVASSPGGACARHTDRR